MSLAIGLITTALSAPDPVISVIQEAGWCREGISVERMALSRPLGHQSGKKASVVSDPPVGPIRFEVDGVPGTAFVRCRQAVVVAKRDLKTGEMFTVENTESKVREISHLSRTGFFKKLADLEDMEARGFVRRGQVIGRFESRKKQLVRAGELIAVIFREKNIEIRAQGQAIQSGAFGETIRIQSGPSKKIVTAMVTGRGVALMKGIYETN